MKALSVFSVVAIIAACDDGVSPSQGLGEPMRVRGAQFVAGDLPGTPGAEPKITSLQIANALVPPGEGAKGTSGRARDTAASIAIRYGARGSGYFVLPIGSPDTAYPGELTWNAALDFATDLAPGFQPLRVVAIDRNGAAGEVFELPLCALGAVPDNYHECDPKSPTPAAVFSLHWDSDVDLDLEVVTPDGRRVGAKQPAAVPQDGGRPALDTPVIDRDSVAGCAIDGIRRESLVWQSAPPSGIYLVYANLASACGKQGVRFDAEIWETQADGTFARTFTRGGQLIADDATGVPLFVVQKEFQ